MYCARFALILGTATGVIKADIVGRAVQDDSEAPVVSAEVRIYRAGVRGLAADLETDGEGRFAAPGLADGDYRIEVSKPNFVSTRVFLGGGVRAVTIRMIRTGAISGRVTLANGKPLSGALVMAMAHDGSEVIQRVPVQPDGQYRIHGLPPGEYRIAVSYGASTANVGSRGEQPPASEAGSGLQFYPSNSRVQPFTILGGEDLRGVDFVVTPGVLANVSGRLELPEQKGSFWIALSAVDQPRVATAVTIAGQDGSFQLKGVPQGSYHVLAAGPSHGHSMMGSVLGPESSFARSRVEVRGEDVTGISLSPQKGRSAGIRLMVAPGDSSNCPATATVTARSTEDWAAGFDYRATARRDQATEITNMAPSRYSLRIEGLGDTCYQASEAILDLSTGAAELVPIQLAGAGSIRGRLNAERTAEFSISLLPLSGERVVRAVRPGAAGAFQFTALPPGRYHIGATKGRLASGQMIEISVAGGRTLEVELAAPPEVVGKP